MSDSENPVIPDYVRTHAVRLCQNLVRVDSLLDLHIFAAGLLARHRELPAEFRQGPTDRPPEVDDVLRSAVVLLDASLEDFLRSVTLAHLPRRESELLKQIPLVGTGSPRQTKYTLSDLTVHSGKNIDAIIDESIDRWLHQRSFNNCDDITTTLKHLGIDASKCNSEFPSLNEMIARRHRIVHNADRDDPSAPDASKLAGISADEVLRWRNAVQQFMQAALHQLHLVVESESKAT